MKTAWLKTPTFSTLAFVVSSIGLAMGLSMGQAVGGSRDALVVNTGTGYFCSLDVAFDEKHLGYRLNWVSVLHN